jgi:hypothetical protein
MGVRDKILAAKVAERVVTLPEGKVLVRGPTIAARDAMQLAAVRKESWRESVLRSCCFDPKSGEPLFEEADELRAIPAHVTEPLIEAVLELAAFTTEEIEELEGNSERTPSVATASA